MQVTDTATAATLAELQRDGLLGDFGTPWTTA